MTDAETTALLERYSRADIPLVELRHRLDGVTFADVLIALADRGLPLPQASQLGREDTLARARALLFPKP